MDSKASNLQTRSDHDILQDVLARIQKTDGGMALSRESQSSVNDRLEELEKRGDSQTPRPLDNADIFGHYNVAYTSTQRSSTQPRSPSGGRFRGKLARRVFKTRKLCQSILKPDIVVNKVEFLLFGLWQGYVGLRGKLVPQGDNKDTVQVLFQPPRLSLGDHINLPVGPQSSVVLTTTYLTPEVRIGKGSRGSLFVFTKGGEAANAGMEEVGLSRTSATGWLILAAITAALLATIPLLWKLNIVGKVVAIIPAVILFGLAQAMLRAAFIDRA